MSEVLNVFPHQVYICDYPEFDKIQESIAGEIKRYLGIDVTMDSNLGDTYDRVHDHPCRGGEYGIMYDVVNFDNPSKPEDITNPELKKLHDWMQDCCREYWKVLDYNEKLNPYILQMWGLYQGPGGFTASHNHGAIPISGVFYVDAEKKGNLVLEDPAELVLSRAPNNKVKGTPKRFNHEIEVKNGRLVLFPGWMKHLSRPNTTQENRILMAINFGCSGRVYFTDLG
jgi:uncharacterized protein (TIGR02466 family)